jgi:hypothetical protein
VADNARIASTHLVAIERVETVGLGAQGFGRWLQEWKALQAEGWTVTVLLARDGSHAVALAIKRR